MVGREVNVRVGREVRGVRVGREVRVWGGYREVNSVRGVGR